MSLLSRLDKAKNKYYTIVISRYRFNAHYGIHPFIVKGIILEAQKLIGGALT